MTKEELEKDYYADRPTEPYCDDDSPNDWANIAHYAEENLEKAFKRIAELEEENVEAKEIIRKILDTPQGWQSGCEWYENEDYDKVISEAKAFLKENKKKEKRCADTDCPILSINNQNMRRVAELEAQIEKMKCLNEEIIKALKETYDYQWLPAHNGKAKFIYLQTVIDIVNEKFKEIEEKKINVVKENINELCNFIDSKCP